MPGTNLKRLTMCDHFRRLAKFVNQLRRAATEEKNTANSAEQIRLA